jgi:hypothetical protein
MSIADARCLVLGIGLGSTGGIVRGWKWYIRRGTPMVEKLVVNN